MDGAKLVWIFSSSFLLLLPPPGAFPSDLLVQESFFQWILLVTQQGQIELIIVNYIWIIWKTVEVQIIAV